MTTDKLSSRNLSDDARDAARYRALRGRGAAPGGTLHLDRGHVMVATNLDAYVDGLIDPRKSITPSHADEGYAASAGGRNLPGKPTVSINTNGTVRHISFDEPVFLIRGQDACGGDAVRAWADIAERTGAEPAAIASARTLAQQMDAWPNKKLADLPGERA